MTLYEIIIDDCPTYFDALGRQWTQAQLVTGNVMWFCDEGNKRPVDDQLVNLHRFPATTSEQPAGVTAYDAERQMASMASMERNAKPQSAPGAVYGAQGQQGLRWRERLSLVFLRVLSLLLFLFVFVFI